MTFAVTSIAKGTADAMSRTLKVGNTAYALPSGGLSAPICALDMTSDTSFLITAPSSAAGSWWGGACVADTGNIYAPPTLAPEILKVDTSTDTASGITIGGSSVQRWTARFRVSPTTGILYAAPNRESQVLLLDPTTDAVSYVAVGISGPRYVAGIFDSAGNFYMPPGRSAQTTKVTPAGVVTSVGGASLDGVTEFKYTGGLLAPNGCIYCAPQRAAQVLKIDPAGSGGAGLTSLIGASLGTGDKYNEGIIVGDVAYFAPQNAFSTILKVDTSTDTVSTIDIVNGNGFWGEGTPYGSSWLFLPTSISETRILQLFPATDTWALHDDLPGGSSYTGSVAGPSGDIYAIAALGSTSIKITPRRRGGGLRVRTLA